MAGEITKPLPEPIFLRSRNDKDYYLVTSTSSFAHDEEASVNDEEAPVDHEAADVDESVCDNIGRYTIEEIRDEHGNAFASASTFNACFKDKPLHLAFTLGRLAFAPRDTSPVTRENTDDARFWVMCDVFDKSIWNIHDFKRHDGDSMSMDEIVPENGETGWGYLPREVFLNPPGKQIGFMQIADANWVSREAEDLE